MEILTLVLSVVAVIVSVVVALYTQRAMNKRERTKWEREELTKIVSELVSLSSQRDQTLRVQYWDAVGWPQSTASLLNDAVALQRMTPLVAQLKLLAPGPLSTAAARLFQEHETSNRAAEDITDQVEALTSMLMSPGVLSILHEKLAVQFRSAIENKKYAPDLSETRIEKIRENEQLELDERNKEIRKRNEEAQQRIANNSTLPIDPT